MQVLCPAPPADHAVNRYADYKDSKRPQQRRNNARSPQPHFFFQGSHLHTTVSVSLI